MTRPHLPTEAPVIASETVHAKPLPPEQGEGQGEGRRKFSDRLAGKRGWILMISVVASALIVAFSMTIGTSGVSMGDVWRALRLAIFGGTLTDDFATDYLVITELRLPRALLAFAAGAGLSLAGALMQGLLRNPLVSPFTLGVSPAAAFGAALAITLGGGRTMPAWIVILSALAMALIVSALVLGLAATKQMAVATLLLIGIAVTQLFESLTAALQFVANENTLQAIVRWTFGSVNEASWGDVGIVGVLVLAALPLTLWFAKDMNAVAFAGDDAARSLGVNVGALRVGLIVVAVLLASVVVSFCGVIGFVGLVGPHIARLIIGSDHRFLLPFSLVAGGLLLLLADTIGRTILAPAVIPVGIVVAFIGAPMFIYLILARRRSLS